METDLSGAVFAIVVPTAIMAWAWHLECQTLTARIETLEEMLAERDANVRALQWRADSAESWSEELEEEAEFAELWAEELAAEIARLEEEIEISA